MFNAKYGKLYKPLRRQSSEHHDDAVVPWRYSEKLSKWLPAPIAVKLKTKEMDGFKRNISK
jgi:hypothetical protein